MTYNKPTLTFLGEAKQVIEGIRGSKENKHTDGLPADPNGNVGPAYDLDD